MRHLWGAPRDDHASCGSLLTPQSSAARDTAAQGIGRHRNDDHDSDDRCPSSTRAKRAVDPGHASPSDTVEYDRRYSVVIRRRVDATDGRFGTGHPE